MVSETLDRPLSPSRSAQPGSVGLTLALWGLSIAALHLVLWIGGFRAYALNAAVERGAARAERAGVGEMGDEVLRKAVQIQQDTSAFWGALVALDDFALEPLMPALRAVSVATLLAGLAALVGRPTRFPEALSAAAWSQGWWVLGLGLRVVLIIALRRTEVETSAVLLLPAGPYSAILWVALRQLDIFPLIGWTSLALGGWRRGQVNLAAALGVCGVLASGEALLRIALTLVTGAGMRLSLLG